MGSGTDIYNQDHFYFSFHGKPDSGFLQAFLDSLVSIETWTVLSPRADTVQMWYDWLTMMFKAVEVIGDVLRLYRHRVVSARFKLYQNREGRERGTMLTDNAKCWDSSKQPRGSFLACLCSVSEVQAAKELPHFLLSVHVLWSQHRTCQAALAPLWSYAPLKTVGCLQDSSVISWTASPL